MKKSVIYKALALAAAIMLISAPVMAVQKTTTVVGSGGESVANTTVTVFDDKGTKVGEGETDEKGAFAFDYPDKGTYTLKHAGGEQVVEVSGPGMSTTQMAAIGGGALVLGVLAGSGSSSSSSTTSDTDGHTDTDTGTDGHTDTDSGGTDADDTPTSSSTCKCGDSGVKLEAVSGCSESQMSTLAGGGCGPVYSAGGYDDISYPSGIAMHWGDCKFMVVCP